MVRGLVLLAWAAMAGAAGSTADLARSISSNGLDPEECYRVRDLTLAREDARFFFTDGYLIFGKPVAGRRISAVFTTDVEGGDAEVLLLAPSRSERKSLAMFTDSPNLNEHFTQAVLLFSDDTYRELSEQIHQKGLDRRSPERGVLLEDQWTRIVRNLSSSVLVRMAQDLATPGEPARGMWIATISGKKLGNFDVGYDPRSNEQMVAGQLVHRGDRTFFNTWTSFQSRSVRRAAKPSEQDFVLSDYRIEATLAPNLELREVTRVKLKAERRTAPVLAFEIHPSMHVSAAKIDGKPVEVFQRESLRADLIRNSGNGMFLVTPPEPLAAGRAYELEFEAAGRIILDAGNHVYYVAARGSWYPNHGLGFSTYDLTFRYPKDLDLVAAGQVVEDRADGEWRVTRRKTAAPVRMAGFNLGRYAHTKVTRGGYTVEAYANRTVERALQPPAREPAPIGPVWPRVRRPDFPPPAQPPPPPSPLARLEELASGVAGALEFMSARFGAAVLPSLTVSPVPGTFGQGFPGLIYLSTLSYLGSPTRLTEQQRVFFHDILQAHETAHQWWGNVVTAAGYHDEWLMEALANYSALLYLEKRKGIHALELTLEEYKRELLAKNESGQMVEAAGPIVLGIRLESSQEPRAWREITYGKGSWIMHMLRRRMGDQRFEGMLAAVCKRYARQEITTEQFQRLAAEFLPPGSPDPKLESFFDHWVYGTGIPELKLTWSVRGKAPSVRLAGKITQGEVEDDFSVPVPVEISFGRGIKTITHWVRTGNEPVSFTVALRQAPAKVALDPGMSVLRR